MRISREHFAPVDVHAMYQEVVPFPRCKGTGRAIDASLVEFDVLRCEEAERRVMEGGFPEGFVSILFAHNASLPENGKSSVLASIRSTLAFAAAARQMRRLFGSCGSAARQDVLIAAGADLFSGEESEHAAWLARRKAKKGKGEAKGGDTYRTSDGRILNGFNLRTQERNRCFTCNSEFHFASQCSRKVDRGEGSTPSTQECTMPSRPPYS